MDLEQYLQRKRSLKEQDNLVKRRETCRTCYRPQKNCLCKHITAFNTRTKFVLLMHPKEAKKQKLGTGRLSHASLINSEIITAENVDNDQSFMSYINSPDHDCFLLYPALDAIVLGEEKSKDKFALSEKQNKEKVIFILDATWPCAKKMMRLSSSLKLMKKVSFPTTHQSEFLIKHQPHECCLSTIESIFHTINYLKEWNIEECDNSKLLDVFKAMIQFQIDCAMDETIPSTRGRKSNKAPTKQRVREKTHRLFYWDIDKSEVGANHSE